MLVDICAPCDLPPSFFSFLSQTVARQAGRCHRADSPSRRSTLLPSPPSWFSLDGIVRKYGRISVVPSPFFLAAPAKSCPFPLFFPPFSVLARAKIWKSFGSPFPFLETTRRRTFVFLFSRFHQGVEQDKRHLVVEGTDYPPRPSLSPPHPARAKLASLFPPFFSRLRQADCRKSRE